MEPFGLESAVAAVGVGAARTLPVAWLVPAFGNRHLPAQIRLVLGGALAVLCLPRLIGHLPQASSGLWVLLIVRELMVGATLGFAASLVFRAAESAGQLVDVARGASLAEAISPGGGDRSSPFAALTLLLALVIFCELGGIGHLAVALGTSYDAMPLAPVVTANQASRVIFLIIAASAKMIEATLGLAAPVLVAVLLADIALAAIARAVPQLPIYFVGMPARALLGVAAALVGLAALDAALVAGFRGWAALVTHLIEAWRP